MYKSQAIDSIISFAVLFYTLKCPASILFCKKKSIITKIKNCVLKTFLKYKVYYQAKKSKNCIPKTDLANKHIHMTIQFNCICTVAKHNNSRLYIVR